MASIKEQLQGQMRQDGIDHVNISTQGETDLGKICSPDWRKKFYVPHMGDFISARAFANWMVSGGDEELRHNSGFYKTRVPVEDFRKLLVFGKYYQLCSMRSNVISQGELVNLPWVMYKRHSSGIREFDRWSNYTAQIKPMIEDILTEVNHGRYNWSEHAPEHLACVNHYLEQITGEDFIPFEKLDQSSRKAQAEKAQTQAQHVQETQEQEQTVETAE